MSPPDNTFRNGCRIMVSKATITRLSTCQPPRMPQRTDRTAVLVACSTSRVRLVPPVKSSVGKRLLNSVRSSGVVVSVVHSTDAALHSRSGRSRPSGHGWFQIPADVPLHAECFMQLSTALLVGSVLMQTILTALPSCAAGDASSVSRSMRMRCTWAASRCSVAPLNCAAHLQPLTLTLKLQGMPLRHCLRTARCNAPLWH
jgi:hypothetical protein